MMYGIIPAKIIQLHHIDSIHISSVKKKDKDEIDYLALTAEVEILGKNREVSIVMLKDPKPGDCVIIQGGYAVQIIDSEYFKYLEMVYRADWEAD